jgi:Arc/MetJ-type ribon-helix-helix transcriptional regulator
MIKYHTRRSYVPKLKVAVTLDEGLLAQVDGLVARGVFPNRSQAIEAAVSEKLERLSRTRLAREAAKLDPVEEKAIAEEGSSADLASWPEY